MLQLRSSVLSLVKIYEFLQAFNCRDYSLSKVDSQEDALYSIMFSIIMRYVTLRGLMPKTRWRVDDVS